MTQTLSDMSLHRVRALMLGLMLALIMPAAWAQVLIGRVVGVTDGDSITVLDDQRKQHKIRLAGIDAPEKTQPFGQRSKAHLSSLVFGRQVLVMTQKKKDRYKRPLGKVIVDGQDVNLAMVVQGLAWHYKKYQHEQSEGDRLLYSSAEQDAREGRRGLWLDPAPIPPWEWRSQKRAEQGR